MERPGTERRLPATRGGRDGAPPEPAGRGPAVRGQGRRVAPARPRPAADSQGLGIGDLRGTVAVARPVRATAGAGTATAARTPGLQPRGAARAAPGTVLSLDRVSRDLLRFTLARPPGFSYAPGSSVKLELGGVRRRYSLASAPHEPALEFFVELVPGGRMSALMAALRPGDRLGISAKAKGGLALDPSARRHLMLATVTGVNPFVGLLRDAVRRGRRELGAVLVQGASHADEFGYRAELAALAAAHPGMLTYIPTVSRPAEPRNAGWTGATGRADAQIDGIVSRLGLKAADTAVYACGNPGMVDIAQQRMGNRGFSVRTERY